MKAKEEIAALLEQAFREARLPSSGGFSLEHPEQEEYGDFATNAALASAKHLKRNPREVAEQLLSILERRKPSFLDRMEIAGPGFLNFFLAPEALHKELALLSQGKYGQKKEKKKIIVEYSSPNIAKRFGIGHLRSTIIGDALSRLYGFLGYKTVGINHIGDWGTPHGIVLYQVDKHVLQEKQGKEAARLLAGLTVDQLEELYVQFNQEAEEQPELKEQARAWFKKLEQGEERARMIWEYARKVSLRDFERVYERLGVRIEHVLGESFYEDKMEVIVREFREKGLSRESEGAVIVEFENMPPAMVVKSDGTTTYFTRDLAAMKYRIEKWKPDALVIETGQEQNLHFRQVFEASQKAGWTKGIELMHVGHGMYRLPEGKFSTRKGRTVRLEEVLDEAAARAGMLIGESETEQGFTEQERNDVAEAIGMGGVKYNDLMHNPQRDVLFEWEKVLNLKGNSGPYIQYAYARCQSILRKEKAPKRSPYRSYSAEEIALMRQLSRFAEAAEEAARSYSPNLLCNFAFELAQRYNTFYHTHRVLQAETGEAKGFRLQLTAATARVLSEALGLLGIRAPERM